jgi:NitT/TauT family transport system permease protein
MGWRKRLFRLELPFSAVNLAWNSLMSMAGGWFFLSVCEAFTLGEQEYRLPGLGAYMAVAISEGNTLAMILGITTMVGVIVMMDVVVWRPALAWVHRFRLEDVPGVSVSEPFIQLMIRESNIYRIIRKIGRRLSLLYRRIKWSLRDIPLKFARTGNFTLLAVVLRSARSRQIAKATFAAIGLAVLVFMLWKLIALAAIFWTVSPYTWLLILKNTIWTLLRVFVTLFISTLWAVPVGIWIGMSPKRVRIAQPIVQVLASFPAPMLYPLALAAFFYLGVSFDYGSMLLMMLGVQWYILFNVLAGAMRIPQELVYVTNLFEVSTLKRWRTLYVPSVFPALVTGWITAAGGAWNASIVAEFFAYKGQTLTTPGLGSTISIAASEANFPLLAASLAVMVVVVVALNRTFWAKVYELSQTRFRMDL